jgi:uncharacterized repeat protein (TIGR01451 family)
MMSATLAIVFMLSFVSVVRGETVPAPDPAPAGTVETVPEVQAPAVEPPAGDVVAVTPAPEAPAPEAPAPDVVVPQPAAPAADPAPELPAPVVEPKVADVQAAAAPVIDPAVQPPQEPPPDPGGYTTVEGNPPLCSPGLRIEDPSSGTHTYSVGDIDVTITLTIVDNGDGPIVSWTSDYPIDSVVVKGGVGGANVYSYSGAFSGSGLHAPLNPSNKWAGLSHIDFCLGEVKPPERGSIIVYKFEDENGNGVWDEGEDPLEDWAFDLKKDGDVIDSDTTDADGKLTFAGLLFGDYQVKETAQAGWSVTTAGGLTQNVSLDESQTTLYFGNMREEEGEWRKHFELTIDGDLRADVDSFRVRYYLNGVLHTRILQESGGKWAVDITVPDGAVISGWVFYAVINGDFIALTAAGGEETISSDVTNTATFTPGTISGNKYLDTDLDRALPPDPDDSPGAGWTITVNGPGVSGATALTNGSGHYEFTGLLPGSYVVDEQLMDGYFRIHPASAANPELTLEGMSATVDFVNGVEVLAPGDLVMEKAANATTVTAGGMITYRITYRNTGETTIEGFHVIDDYPQQYVDVISAGGAVDNGDTLTWTITDPLAPGATGSVVYSVRVGSDVPRGTRIINVATIPEFQLEDTATVRVVAEFLPFTPTPTGVSAPFLPFTGGELLILLFAANMAAGTGMLLRRLARR